LPKRNIVLERALRSSMNPRRDAGVTLAMSPRWEEPMDHRLRALALALLMLSACLDRELKPLNPCLVTARTQRVQVKSVTKVDMLFMVDNSNSMAGEQASLRAQFPRLIRMLTSGERSPGDPDTFPPIEDLHVGVVSSDMGIPGVEFGACHADGGDDGRLQHTPRGAGCAPSYPSFLSFDDRAMSDRAAFANDVGCIAALGTGGCGFEQQLEAPLKALWPSVLTDSSGNVVQPNPIRFLATTPQGQLGRGDRDNLGFLRNDPALGLSLIAIVVVTDEEDCSVKSTEHLWPTALLPDDSPYKPEVDINLRCFDHPELSYALDRYYNGFRALRPGNEELVTFAAIVGVPTDTVDSAALARVDLSDQASRDRFYDGILVDPRMQEQIDPSTHPGSGSGNLRPSCVRQVAGESEPSTAFPPRRIVELARRFGQNGIVQSICQDDFGPAMDAIIQMLWSDLPAPCLPHPLVRRSDGLVDCKLLWELPKVALPGSGAPARCEQESFLSPATSTTIGSAGGALCELRQLPVTEHDPDAAPSGEGWFYDDYSRELQRVCSKFQPRRIAFTAQARPPLGVKVKLECLDETQHITDTRSAMSAAGPQPEIGSACGEVDPKQAHGDAACLVTLADGTLDAALFCHPEREVCVRRCASDADCPPAWVCDARPETLAIPNLPSAYCVNPTCNAE
jgi:hypothetical protein